MSDSFLPPGGNYQDFLAYQKAEVVYDITFRIELDRQKTQGHAPARRPVSALQQPHRRNRKVAEDVRRDYSNPMLDFQEVKRCGSMFNQKVYSMLGKQVAARIIQVLDDGSDPGK